MSDYEISVITPFHNVDLRFFRAAVESMRNQTIGFDRIQWIVVVHNCRPGTLDELRALLGGCPNVILVPLENDAKTPSSPRNYGMTFATAKYVGFLDGDDSYKPDCLAECVRNAEETNAQVVCFRRDYELENESLWPMTEITLWNQLEKRIVIDRGDWQGMQTIFDGLFSFVTSKVFDREFLLKRGIAFDEEVPYCEDSLYSMCALAQADHVCILPQLIGYHYFINGASLVQAQAKDSKTLVAYARGLVKIFLRGYDFGIDINFFAQRLMLHVCNFMLHSKMEQEDREEIKRLFAPIIYRTTPVKTSKIVSEEWSDYAFHMCREVILNTDASRDSKVLKELCSGWQNLRKILGRNRDSDYGRKYQFGNLKTIAAFQYHVPLTRLASYRKLVDLQVSIGEHGILTSDRIIGYVTEGESLVPFTDDHLKPYVLAVAKTLKGHHNLWVAQCELSGRKLNDRTRMHTLGSLIVRNYFFDYVYGGGERPAELSAPDGAFFSATEVANDYSSILHYALLDRDIDQVVAATATKMLKMFRLLETCRAAVLGRLCAADPVRGAEVKAALDDFDAGREKNLVRRLWPKLGRIVACGSGSHAQARAELRRFTGDVVWNNGHVFLSEMVVAHAEADESDRYVFDATDCFCEFFQNDSDDIAKPITQSELQEGHTYNVIVTNGAGLYRVVTDIEILVVRADADGLLVELRR